MNCTTEGPARKISRKSGVYLKKGLPIDVAELCLMAHRAVSSLDCLGDMYMADNLAGAMKPFLEIVDNKQSPRDEKVVAGMFIPTDGMTREIIEAFTNVGNAMIALESKIDAMAAKVK